MSPPTPVGGAGHHGHGHDHHTSHNHPGALEDHTYHDHDHAHDHGMFRHHAHVPKDFGRAFAIGIGLNAAFVIVEAVYGVIGHSMSLLADAGHNLSDVLGLAVAYGASRLSRRAATARFTYGLRSSSILAALFNAVFLLVIVGGLVWEAILRLVDPGPVAGTMVMVVAGVGILVNGVTAWLFASGRDADINIKGAYLHMAADALVSVGVVVAGSLILLTGWTWIDPLTSLAVNALIVAATIGLLRDSMSMALQAVPAGIATRSVADVLAASPGVTQLHDLHIWPISTTETALTVHLVMPGGHPGDAYLAGLAETMRTRFAVSHATFQIEVSPVPICILATADAVCGGGQAAA